MDSPAAIRTAACAETLHDALLELMQTSKHRSFLYGCQRCVALSCCQAVLSQRPQQLLCTGGGVLQVLGSVRRPLQLLCAPYQRPERPCQHQRGAPHRATAAVALCGALLPGPEVFRSAWHAPALPCGWSNLLQEAGIVALSLQLTAAR